MWLRDTENATISKSIGKTVVQVKQANRKLLTCTNPIATNRLRSITSA